MTIRIALSTIVILAALFDWRERRIPNWLTLPALPLAITLQAIVGDGLVEALLGAAAAFVPFFLLFALGARGAGDVKLFTVVGAFVGIHNLLPVFVLVALIGGVAGIVVAMRAGALSRVLANVGRIAAALFQGRLGEVKARSDVQQAGALRLAYGVVIAAGTLLFLWFPR
jgi:prepilin peptidase CpaA